MKSGPPKTRKIMNITVVCDHAIFCTGLEAVLMQEFKNAKIAKYNTLADLKKPHSLPELILLGISAGNHTTELNDQLEKLKVSLPNARVILVEVEINHEIRTNLPKVFRWGITGYLTKDSSLKEIARCVEKVNAGERFISEELLHWIFNRLIENENQSLQSPGKRVTKLTRIEMEIARMLSDGQKVSEIANKTGRKPSTVSAIKKNILKKTNTDNIVKLHQFLAVGDTANALYANS